MYDKILENQRPGHQRLSYQSIILVFWMPCNQPVGTIVKIS